MAALDKIIQWAQKEIPPWQGDAVRRFLLCECLTPDEKEELFLMMKIYYGLLEKADEKRELILPKPEDISGSGKTGEKIILKGLEYGNKTFRQLEKWLCS